MKRIAGLLVVLLLGLAAFSFGAETDNLWAKFNVGSWALYSVGPDMQQKVTLVGKNQESVKLKIEMIVSGSTISSQEVDMQIVKEGPQDSSGKQAKLPQEVLYVKGRRLTCKIVESNTMMGPSKSWVSEEVPGGVVKSILGSQVAQELIDYGIK